MYNIEVYRGFLWNFGTKPLTNTSLMTLVVPNKSGTNLELWNFGTKTCTVLSTS